MISMDIRHPDIEAFVKMKQDLAKVTGANVSVKISDSFMKAVEENKPFTLQFPVDADTRSTQPTSMRQRCGIQLLNRQHDCRAGPPDVGQHHQEPPGPRVPRVSKLRQLTPAERSHFQLMTRVD
jgi:ribonucleotide reductase alpha subunit